jgi:hypothetical protein
VCVNRRLMVSIGVLALGILVVALHTMGAVSTLVFVVACLLSTIFMICARNGRSGTARTIETSALPAGVDSETVSRMVHLRALHHQLDRLEVELDALQASCVEAGGSPAKAPGSAVPDAPS